MLVFFSFPLETFRIFPCHFIFLNFLLLCSHVVLPFPFIIGILLDLSIWDLFFTFLYFCKFYLHYFFHFFSPLHFYSSFFYLLLSRCWHFHFYNPCFFIFFYICYFSVGEWLLMWHPNNLADTYINHIGKA